jgi:hypothetical protein
MTRRRLAVSAALLALACGGTEPGAQQVSVTGSLTSAGHPVTAFGFVSLGVTGATDPLVVVSASFDGSYGISGEVDAADCGRVFVAVAIVDSFGQTVAEAVEDLGSCGTHEVDLILGP